MRPSLLSLVLVLSLASCKHDHGPVPDASVADLADEDATVELGAGGDGGALDSYGDRNLGVHEPYPASVLIQNGGRFYDVTHPPTSAQHIAKGDGVTDDTLAITDAYDYVKNAIVNAKTSTPIDSYSVSNFWIYLPAGTYRVTSTLYYTGAMITAPNSTFEELVRVRIVGESRESTIIKLDDGAAGFSDPTHPKEVVSYASPSASFNNWPADNVLRNLTIDTGKNNPGAVGLVFQGANVTSLANVLIRSDDGAGACGLFFRTGSVQGYYRDFTVEGFSRGLCQEVNGEMDAALEHVTFRGQSDAAVHVSGGGLSLRAALVDESTTAAEGLRIEQTGGVVFVDHSLFQGGGHGHALEQTATADEYLYVRDVTTTGYDDAITQAGAVAVLGPDVSEWNADAPVELFGADGGTSAPRTLHLPVEDTPLVPWFDPATQWASVDDFGAKGDGTTDDTVAIQMAMSSGKPVVVFPKTTYKFGTVHVPATVERVDLMYTSPNGSFDIEESSSTPVVFENKNGGAVTSNVARPVVLRAGGSSYANTSGVAGKLYIENVSGIGAGPSFAPALQTTWARGVNDELATGGPDIVANGGTLWLMGYKTENKPVTSVSAQNGATVEVLNGYVNCTTAPGTTPMITNVDSTMSFIGFTNLFGNFSNVITETQGGATRTLSLDPTSLSNPALPQRGSTYSHNFVVPLYYGAP